METRVFADEQTAAEAAVCSGLSCSLDSRTTRHDHRPVLQNSTGRNGSIRLPQPRKHFGFFCACH